MSIQTTTLRTPRLAKSSTITRGALGFGLVLLASASVQISAVLSRTLFDRLTPMGVSGLRFAIAALCMVAIARPRLSGRSRAQWGLIALYGTSIGSMNVFMYQALTTLPLGVVITMEFLGPFAVAVLASRRPRQALFAMLGLFGVVLIARPSAAFNLTGILFGALAALALAAYIVVADRIGQHGGGSGELALAFVVAAILTSPFAVSAASSVVWSDVPTLAMSAVLGVVLAFTADFVAVQVTGARTVAVLLSLDPVLAAVIGALALGEHLDRITLVGMVCVSIAGGLAAFTRDATT